MLNWLKSLFSRSTSTSFTPSHDDRNRAAHEELNRIRRDELSVGSAMRRGEIVQTSPGIASGQTAPIYRAAPSVYGSRSTSSYAPIQPRDDDGDFLTSMAVGAATDSTLAGYAAGGSLSGAMIGAALSSNDDSRCEPSNDSGDDSSNDSGDDSSSDSCGSDGSSND